MALTLLQVVLLGFTVFAAFLEICSAQTLDKAGIEFCEGKRSYYQALLSQCKAGFVIGKREPRCVCTRGIHRLFYIYNDDGSRCTYKDHFGDEVCSVGRLDGGRERLASIQIIPEPDWKNTHVVYDKWDPDGSISFEIASIEPITGRGRKIHTRANHFYTINGKAFVMNDGTNPEWLCVQKQKPVSDVGEVCHYWQADNPDWTMKDTEINLYSHPCSSISDKAMPLHAETCSAPETYESSECELECNREGENQAVGLPELKNCTDAEKSIMFDNQYLDRQLSQHALMIQLYETAPIALAQPNRTFDLFMRMVNITRGYCPNEYVPTSWVKHLTELFYILHKGREFQYEEVLSVDDYNWIGNILDQCEAKQYRVNLTNGGGLNDSQCEADHVGGKAWGYCKDRECKTPVQILPTAEKTGMKLKHKHYIPELAWNIVDAVQAICFHQFRASYRMFHILQQAAEKLFTPDIRHLWYNPPYLKDLKRKARLVGPGSDETMHNLEICIGSAYHITNEANKRRKQENEVTIIPRLMRPPKITYLRRKRRSPSTNTPPGKSISKFTDVYCAKTKAEFHLPSCAYPKPPPDTSSTSTSTDASFVMPDGTIIS